MPESNDYKNQYLSKGVLEDKPAEYLAYKMIKMAFSGVECPSYKRTKTETGA